MQITQTYVEAQMYQMRILLYLNSFYGEKTLFVVFVEPFLIKQVPKITKNMFKINEDGYLLFPRPIPNEKSISMSDDCENINNES